MDRRERLLDLIRERLQELGGAPEALLSDAEPLISSGLLDSLAILHLAEWVDAEIDGALDLDATDIEREWNTVGDILEFIERRR